MTNDQKLRVGIFETLRNARTAIQLLKDTGVGIERVSVVCSQDIDELAGAPRIEPAGAHTGVAAATGSIGSILGVVGAASVVGTGGLTLVGIGPLIGGAVAMGITGGFLGAMMSRGLEPEVADFYDQALQEGQVLVAVEASEAEERPTQAEAERVLEIAGARTHSLRPA